MRILISISALLIATTAQAAELFCEGFFDPQAGYTVTGAIDESGMVATNLQMDYRDNDGFEFNYKVIAQPTLVKAGRDFIINGRMDEGTMKLAGFWNEEKRNFEGALTAVGNMGEGFDLDVACEIR